MFKFDIVCDSGLGWLQATIGLFSADEMPTTEWHNEVKNEAILFMLYQFFLSAYLFLILFHLFLRLSFFPPICLFSYKPVHPSAHRVCKSLISVAHHILRNLLLMTFNLVVVANLMRSLTICTALPLLCR
jgi:hypothetical protein